MVDQEQNLKLFINYRRDDEQIFVENIGTHFMYRYGQANVFMDFDSIPAFVLFEDFIRQKVRECDVLVVVIGPRWLDILHRKAENGGMDYVLIEIEEALHHNKIIAPICIQGAKTPTTEQLPPLLHPIFRRHVGELQSGKHILQNIGTLMKSLEEEIARQGKTRTIAIPDEEALLMQTEAPAFDTVMHQFYEARNANDHTATLFRLAQLREFGDSIPSYFRLDQKEEEIQAVLKQEQDRRRLEEVAEYHYRIVRMMHQNRENPQTVAEALQETWKFAAHYDPDNLKPIYFPPKPELPQTEPTFPYSPTNATTFKLQLPKEMVETKIDWDTPFRAVLGELFEWCEVAAGKVTLEDASTYGGTSGGEYQLPAFALAKYPLTVAQYEPFVTAGGYEQPQFWLEAGWLWKIRKNITQPRFWQDPRFHQATHPIVGISWYEAMAFCAWLETQVRTHTRLYFQVNLPTEQQWQRAAQGDQTRRYPWGDIIAPLFANYQGSKIGGTTPVTKYSRGGSPYGVMDMVGNVWEWCLTQWSKDSAEQEGTDERALRGGSWQYGDKFLLVTSRSGGNPDVRDNDSGFRIARLSEGGS